MDETQQILTAGLDALALELTQVQQQKLLNFIQLIVKWNRSYNLTAIREPAAMMRLHILDSLLCLPHIKGVNIADIGTGAGIPGIPLAICRPEIQFMLIDSNAKKTRFVQQAILELQLTNVTVHQSRVETLDTTNKFDLIISRAFSSLQNYFTWGQHLLAPNGSMLAMKAQIPITELAELSCEARVIQLQPVLDLAEQRCLVVLK